MATRSFGGSSQHFNGNLGQDEAQGAMGQMRQAAEAVPGQARQVVEDYPLSTVLAVFGLGMGVGVCLGMTLFSQSSSSYSSSNWFPAMSSHGSSWLPSGSNSSWFGNGSSSNWTDSLMKSAKGACGY